MIKQNFIEGFNKSVSTRNLSDGMRVLNNDLIEDINYSFSESTGEITIDTSVISENLYSKYNCNIVINSNTYEVLNTKCTCKDFEKNEITKHNYVCKHLCASFYRFLEKLSDDELLKKQLNTNIDNKFKSKNSIDTLDILLGDNYKDNLRIDVYINKNSWSNKIGAEFRIGIKPSKMYLIKDINMFLVNKYNEVPIKYSKDFTFDIKKQKLSYEDIRLFKFIEVLKNIDINSNNFKRSQDRYVNGKEIWIPNGIIRNFFEIIKNNRVYLNNGFYARKIESEIIEEDIPLPIELSEKNNNIKLKLLRGMPEDLSGNGDVFLYDTIIYLPSMNQCEKLSNFIKVFLNTDEIKFLEHQKDRVYKELIPNLRKVSNTVILDKSISKNIVVSSVKFKFYFDRETSIILKLNVVYGEFEFNIFDSIKDKFIYRDTKKEEEVLNLLKNLGIERIDNSNIFTFYKEDEYIFDFFKNNINIIQDIGEVFYSEKFKGIVSLDKNKFNIDVRRGKENYFNFRYSVSNISEEEFYNILKSFKDNKKYYRLENGEFIDLEEIQNKELLRVIDTLSEEKINTNEVEFSTNKAIYADFKLNKLFGDFNGSNLLKDITKKLENILSSKTLVPKDLKAELRDYQISGLKWFNDLYSLGFGGILGDEMGLGKTIQAISFILSNKGSKSLIVAPTSLIYNWRDEFLKFAPNLKVAIVNGSKKSRCELIKNIDKYDVILTTYNLLRIDILLYDKIYFDICFLDEAQYIKNPLAKNTKACKKINAKSKFALTGTPMENNLMELWSIFDFIMPGFLYSKDRFNSRYNRALEEDEVIIKELQMLISPFILRRLKKDVLNELPDKIEKVISIDMTREQKKVYASYAKYVNDIIEDKVQNDEFNKSKIEILSYITKLRQICLDPSLVMENYTGGSGKFEALMEILNDMIENNHKVLIFSQFTSVLSKLKELLKANNLSYYYIDGSIKSSKRQELVNKFNNDLTNIFLISLKAGGTGLNLTSADIVIHFDPWWNPAVEEQATDRAHRIGQKNVVEVIKLISEGTIEEKIINLQEKKKEVIENLIGEDSLSNMAFSNLSKDTIFKLFDRD